MKTIELGLVVTAIMLGIAFELVLARSSMGVVLRHIARCKQTITRRRR